ncbi:MAG: sugar porter family MFS transporter [Bacteroidota bacterium]
MEKRGFIVMTALIVALGGFLMGFDASVISGVNEFIVPEFNLTSIELGWAVASLTLVATLAMLIAGPLSDRYGRRRVLSVAAILYAISAIGSALAPDYLSLIIARMIGGIGVGASLIIAPMYIAEISPPKVRGQMVSFNQLNIVLGLFIAFVTNYMILQLGKSDAEWAIALKFKEFNWRWMLGLEAVPAILYFFGLLFVPRSPRWLIMKGKFEEALNVMKKATANDKAEAQLQSIRENVSEDKNKEKVSMAEIFKPALRLVLTIGIVIAILQQITGINSVFFYAPMIFKQTGAGQDAAFWQSIIVGFINIVFTILAILFIERLGRKPLLTYGVLGIVISMGMISYGFYNASYELTAEDLNSFPTEIQKPLSSLQDQVFDSELDFKATVKSALGEGLFKEMGDDIIKASTNPESSNTSYELTEEGLNSLPTMIQQPLSSLQDKKFSSASEFETSVISTLGEEVFKEKRDDIITASINANSTLILIAILSFIACFAFSLGPVMWVLFSELFPNAVRAAAISFVGMINSGVSFLIQFIFPLELELIGSTATFLIFGLFALAGLVFIIRTVPETKGRSLEELEELLVKSKQ